ncbi:MAG: hypothetical protein ACRCYV_10505 [Aeromonas sp.]
MIDLYRGKNDTCSLLKEKTGLTEKHCNQSGLTKDTGLCIKAVNFIVLHDLECIENVVMKEEFLQCFKKKSVELKLAAIEKQKKEEQEELNRKKKAHEQYLRSPKGKAELKKVIKNNRICLRIKNEIDSMYGVYYSNLEHVGEFGSYLRCVISGYDSMTAGVIFFVMYDYNSKKYSIKSR